MPAPLAPSPDLSSLSDADLVALAAQHPTLEHMSDEQLAGLAVTQGLLQEGEAVQAVQEKKQRERAPIASAVASGLAMNPTAPLPAPVAEAMLTRGGRVGDVAAEVLTPLAGSAVGSLAMPVGGTMAGGAAGGLAGESLAEARQYFRGERDAASPGALIATTAASAVPLGGRLLKTPARVIATRAAQGAAIATTAEAVRQAIDEHRIDFAGLLATGALGSIFGAGAGTVESLATRRAVLRMIRGTPEFKDFDGSDAELVQAVRSKLASEPAPAAPRDVTPAAPGEAMPPAVVPAEPAAPAAPEAPAPATSATAAPAVVSESQPPVPGAENATPVAPRVLSTGQPEPTTAPAAELAKLSDEELQRLAAGPSPAQDATPAPATPPEAAASGSETVAPAVAGEETMPPTVGKGKSLRFAPRPDGVTDLIDVIHDMGGVPKPPAGATGGEWDGFKETFRGSARILMRPGKTDVGIDQFLQDLAATHPQFAHLEKDPGAFYSEVQRTLTERSRLKTANAIEQQAGKFAEAALEGKGRPVAVSPDDGSVTVKDGPRFGTQILPAGAELHADKGTFKPRPVGEPEFLPGDAEEKPAAPRELVTKNVEQMTPEEIRATAKVRLSQTDDLLVKLGPNDGTRWDAIENTYKLSKAAMAALPGVPLKDVWGVWIFPKPHNPNARPVDVIFVPRGQNVNTELAKKIEAAYPVTQFMERLSSSHEPYKPRKGEPQFKAWLSGDRPTQEEIKTIEMGGKIRGAAKGSFIPEPVKAESAVPAGTDLFGGDAPFNLASEEQATPAAPAAPVDVTGELFNPAETRSTAPTALDKANAAARDGQPPRTAAMGSSAPRASKSTPSAGEQRVAAAEAATRTAEQKASGLDLAGRALRPIAKPEAGAAQWFRGLRAIVAPQTLDAGAAAMGQILRAAFGAEYATMQRADAALSEFRREFDRTPVPRNWEYREGERLPRNYAVMAAIDSGQLAGLTAAEQDFARAMRAQLDAAIEEVHKVSPHSLRELLENYFPRIWQDPEKQAAKINALLSARPLEGSKAFLKQRTLSYFTDGLKQGLVPASDNPADVALMKLGEMTRFTVMRRAMQEARAVGLRKFKYVYEAMPEGWRAVDDRSSDVWAPPTVTVQEAFDAQLRAKTIEMLEQLGIPHERTTKMGGSRWGEARQGEGIRTKFGGPDFVFWHEAGHMLDWRYPELRELTGAMDRGAKGQQMRALADLRFEGENRIAEGFNVRWKEGDKYKSKFFRDREAADAHAKQVGGRVMPGKQGDSYVKYVRQTEEKIANMFDAYIRAPDKFSQVAPDVWRDFTGWLDQHPEVRRPLDAIRPSLRLGSGTAEQFVGGPIKLGDWIMPEGAAQIVDNYLQPGLGRHAWFRGLRDVSGIANGAQLLGFFHGQFVMNDSFYSGLGLALYDALNGKPVRAARELLQVPISPFTSWWRGRQIQQAIARPDAASETMRQISQLAIEANLRAGHGPNETQFARQWLRAVRELRQAPSTGAAWEAFARAPFAGLELALAPIMRGLVPPMKLGIFARMAERVMADNPRADLTTLRAKLAEAADATEDRLGQVTYDNLFQRRTLKDAMQLALRAYGWQLTKYRMLGGGAADWARAARDAASGKKPTFSFRMTYIPAMVIGHVILAATLHYMMTGRRPESWKDYMFPDTGLKDRLGRPVRIALADFVKDILADWRSFPNVSRMGAEWSHKLAPMWGQMADMYQNRDFYGTEIFSSKALGEPEFDHLLKNLGEGAAYLGKSAQPFSVRGGQKFIEAGADPAIGYAAPFVGFVPAPRYAIETPMQAYLSDEAGRDQYTRTREQARQAEIAREITGALRDRKGLTAAQQQAMRSLSREQLQRAAAKAFLDPDVWAIRALDVDKAMKAWDLASDDEKARISPTVRLKILNAFTAGGRDPETLKRYLFLVNQPARKR